MASSTRGKLKENIEGIHRNCEWIHQHCTKSIALLPDDYKTLEDHFEGIMKITEQLDKFTLALYAKI